MPRDSSSLSKTRERIQAREHELDRAPAVSTLNEVVTAHVLRRSELGEQLWQYAIIREIVLQDQALQPTFIRIDFQH